MSDTGRIIAHFSCGAASALAWKVAHERYAKERTAEAVYCAGVEKDEHPDNVRFMADVERWVGAKVRWVWPASARKERDGAGKETATA
jgi:hypothetical protein